MIVLRPLARLLTFVLLLAVALAGLAVAVFSVESTRRGLSIPGLAHDARLPELRDHVGRVLARVEADGPIAAVAGLCGLGAIAVGLLLLLGTVGSRRERLIELDDEGEDGRTAARRRPLAQVAVTLAEQVRDVTAAEARARSGRRRGTVRVSVAHGAGVDRDHLHAEVEDALSSFAAVGLQTRVQERRGARGERVS